MEDICRITVAARVEPFLECLEGDTLARIACVTSGPVPLPEAVRSALDKALAALGWPPERFVAASTRTLAGERLRLCLESLDPLVTVALDTGAAGLIAVAYGAAVPAPGASVQLPLGRRLVVVDGFAEALGSVEAKRVVWHQLRAAAPVPYLP